MISYGAGMGRTARALRWSCLLSCVVLEVPSLRGWSGIARAADVGSAPIKQAREHYERGLRLYNVGRYEEAIAEFTAGYLVVPKPAFLLDLGQAYRALRQNDRAKESYRRFLHETPLTDPRRAGVEQILTELDHASAPGPAESPPSPGPQFGVRPLEPGGELTAPPARPRRARWWIGGVVAGGVLTVAGAILGGVLGSAASQRPPFVSNSGAGPFVLSP
jgi:hypothetical protein